MKVKYDILYKLKPKVKGVEINYPVLNNEVELNNIEDVIKFFLKILALPLILIKYDPAISILLKQHGLNIKEHIYTTGNETKLVYHINDVVSRNEIHWEGNLKFDTFKLIKLHHYPILLEDKFELTFEFIKHKINYTIFDHTHPKNIVEFDRTKYVNFVALIYPNLSYVTLIRIEKDLIDKFFDFLKKIRIYERVLPHSVLTSEKPTSEIIKQLNRLLSKIDKFLHSI